jgi:Bacterial regulatory protein, Fis family
MELNDAVALALVTQDPRRSAETALGQVLIHLRATAAALFRLGQRRRLALFASSGVDQADLDRAQDAWHDASESILAGNPYTEEQFALLPLQDPPSGILYVGARRPLWLQPRAMEALRKIEPLLLAALEGEDPPAAVSPIETYLEMTPPEQVEREQLAVLLRRNDWNISRVARILGVSRVTVYARLAKLRMPRVRPLRGEP